jgi:dTDP-4-dehydrorhamnose reductase
MRVLITGANGQLGGALQRTAPAWAEINAIDADDCDFTEVSMLRARLTVEAPDVILNAAAYTAVDKAESDEELARAINSVAVATMVEAMAETGGKVVHVSTDYVFDGASACAYLPIAERNPQSAYGRTKAAGEEAVEEVLGSSGQGVILRTSWVMGPVGKNFALTMLRLHRERGASGQSLGVVADQVGCPTSTQTLATACWRVIAATDTTAGLPAVLHWSDAGAASWYDVAVAVGELGEELGLVERKAHVNPLTTAEFPTPTERPSYSLLDCSASRAALELAPTPWRQALRQLLVGIS